LLVRLVMATQPVDICFMSPEEVDFAEGVCTTEAVTLQNDAGNEKRSMYIGVDNATSPRRELLLRETYIRDSGHAGVDASGGRCWDAAWVLARWLWDHGKELLCDQTVLELGAGIGLPGIIASLYAKRVTLSELPESLVLANLKENVQWTNQHLAAEQSCVIDTVGIYWGADCAAVGLQQDVVLGSDLVYVDDEVTLQGLVDIICCVLKPNGVCWIVQDMSRAGCDRFVELVAKANLQLKLDRIPSCFMYAPSGC